MKLAIEQARLAASIPGAGAVGCVIVRNGRILASGYNEAEMNCDPTAHAEIVTLRRLGRQEGRIRFYGCSLDVILQPCTMCTSACVWAGMNRIVYGASREDVHSMYFDAKHIDPIDLMKDAYKKYFHWGRRAGFRVRTALLSAPGSSSSGSPDQHQVVIFPKSKCVVNSVLTLTITRSA